MHLYVTGDTHGTRHLKKLLPQALEGYEEGSAFIVLGDFGLAYMEEQSLLEDKYLTLLESMPHLFCFIDGDGDNLARLSRYGEISWQGGRARKVRENVLYLERGEIYDICGISLLCLGGARTVSSPMATLRPEGAGADISDGDVRRALENLEKRGMAVDCVLTHQCPGRADEAGFPALAAGASGEGSRRWLDEKLRDPNRAKLDALLDAGVRFGKWYFGHYHVDADFGRYRCVFGDVAQLAKTSASGGEKMARPAAAAEGGKA